MNVLKYAFPVAGAALSLQLVEPVKLEVPAASLVLSVTLAAVAGRAASATMAAAMGQKVGTFGAGKGLEPRKPLKHVPVLKGMTNGDWGKPATVQGL